MKNAYFAVYILNPRRRKCVLAGRLHNTREGAIESEAAKRKDAVIVSGTTADLLPVLTQERVDALICHMAADSEPIATD